MIELLKQNFKVNKKLYNQKEKNLKTKIGEDYPITHVGSTAIPNMYGKNIIDILIGVNNIMELELIANQLTDIGYFCSDKNKDNIYRFFASTNSETKSGDVHIHLVIKETERYTDFIVLKDYLLHNVIESKNYSNFKKELISKNVSDRKEYKRIKSEYVTNLLLRARKNHSK